jgi:hypothetical protein
MNAVLAKPIQPIWFIQTRLVDLHQSLLRCFARVCRRGCATIRRCPARPRIGAMHN